MPNYKNIYIALSGLAIITLGYLFYPSAITLDNRWNTNHESYSHGYVLLIISIILALRQWQDIKIRCMPVERVFFYSVVWHSLLRIDDTCDG